MFTARVQPITFSFPNSKPSYIPGSVVQGHEVIRARTVWKEIHPGFGSRAIHDNAPFSLWDSVTSSYRWPTQDEGLWIFQAFNAKSVDIDFPDLVIRTNEPPNPVPITVAGCLARFVPDNVEFRGIIGKPIGHLRPYGSSNVKDVLPYRLPKWSFPNERQCYEAVEKLEELMDIRAIHFFPPIVVIELKPDKKYARKSLPETVGGLMIFYHHAEEEYFSGKQEKSFERLINPLKNTRDESNYLSSPYRTMCPGVCLSSSPISLTTDHYSTTWKSSSAGILIQKGREQRLTVANHAFKDSSEVFHPTPNGIRIGEIVERHEEMDLALVKLYPSIAFTNDSYFGSNTPKRLVSAFNIPAGRIFVADGMSSGAVDFISRTLSLYEPETVPSNFSVRYSRWRPFNILSVFGSTGSSLEEGICGAPLVDDLGNVGGLFRFVDESGMWAYCPPTDFISFLGWTVV